MVIAGGWRGPLVRLDLYMEINILAGETAHLCPFP